MEEIKQFITNEYDQAEKTTHIDYGNTVILSVKLKNGYVIVEHCICRDPKNFDLEKGIEICKEKIIQKLLSIYEIVESKAE